MYFDATQFGYQIKCFDLNLLICIITRNYIHNHVIICKALLRLTFIIVFYQSFLVSSSTIYIWHDFSKCIFRNFQLSPSTLGNVIGSWLIMLRTHWNHFCFFPLDHNILFWNNDAWNVIKSSINFKIEEQIRIWLITNNLEIFD